MDLQIDYYSTVITFRYINFYVFFISPPIHILNCVILINYFFIFRIMEKKPLWNKKKVSNKHK